MTSSMRVWNASSIANSALMAFAAGVLVFVVSSAAAYGVFYVAYVSEYHGECYRESADDQGEERYECVESEYLDNIDDSLGYWVVIGLCLIFGVVCAYACGFIVAVHQTRKLLARCGVWRAARIVTLPWLIALLAPIPPYILTLELGSLYASGVVCTVTCAIAWTTSYIVAAQVVLRAQAPTSS